MFEENFEFILLSKMKCICAQYDWKAFNTFQSPTIPPLTRNFHNFNQYSFFGEVQQEFLSWCSFWFTILAAAFPTLSLTGSSMRYFLPFSLVLLRSLVSCTKLAFLRFPLLSKSEKDFNCCYSHHLWYLSLYCNKFLYFLFHFIFDKKLSSK